MRIRKLVLLVCIVALLAGGLFISTPQKVNAECGVYHTVQTGQNLFRISLRYGVTMSAIANANGIANINRIFVGQRLYIPCPGATTPAGSTSVTPFPYHGEPGGPTPIPGTTLDCTGFRGTSPDAFSNGTDTFFWDPPSNIQVARYQIRITNDRGANVGSFETLAPNTNLSADTSIASIGDGTKFYWYVVAVTADNRICQTTTRYAQREWPPQ